MNQQENLFALAKRVGNSLSELVTNYSLIFSEILASPTLRKRFLLRLRDLGIER